MPSKNQKRSWVIYPSQEFNGSSLSMIAQAVPWSMETSSTRSQKHITRCPRLLFHLLIKPDRWTAKSRVDLKMLRSYGPKHVPEVGSEGSRVEGPLIVD